MWVSVIEEEVDEADVIRDRGGRPDRAKGESRPVADESDRVGERRGDLAMDSWREWGCAFGMLVLFGRRDGYDGGGPFDQHVPQLNSQLVRRFCRRCCVPCSSPFPKYGMPNEAMQPRRRTHLHPVPVPSPAD